MVVVRTQNPGVALVPPNTTTTHLVTLATLCCNAAHLAVVGGLTKD